MSGRYASYLNAFLLPKLFSSSLCKPSVPALYNYRKTLLSCFEDALEYNECLPDEVEEACRDTLFQELAQNTDNDESTQCG